MSGIDLRLLPPVGHGTQNNRPIWTRIPLAQREKWRKKWAAMDAAGKEARHYSSYERELRKTLEELETREGQLFECVRKGPQ